MSAFWEAHRLALFVAEQLLPIAIQSYWKVWKIEENKGKKNIAFDIVHP